MKVLVTGAKGMLGREVVRAFSRRYNTVGLSHGDLEITDLTGVLTLFREERPDIVVHTAAYTDVDGCEGAPERAYRINGLGTRNVAIGCAETGAIMVYISTDYVFDGRKGRPYTELDRPSPVNTYGLSKLMGEEFIKDLLWRYYIVRTSWLFGRGGRNFVEAILTRGREGRALEVVDDQMGIPTYTADLAGKLVEVVERGGFGTYHITNTGQCSWYDFACKILELSKIDNVSLKAIKSWELARPARRPSFSVLDNLLLRLEGLSPLRDWEEALREYLSYG